MSANDLPEHDDDCYEVVYPSCFVEYCISIGLEIPSICTSPNGDVFWVVEKIRPVKPAFLEDIEILHSKYEYFCYFKELLGNIDDSSKYEFSIDASNISICVKP